MLYTTQQLQGGPKYSHKTRIGNWKEDIELEEIKQIDYNKKLDCAGLGFHKTLSKVESSYTKVPWSYSQDSKLRCGDQIMIQNSQTKGFMVIDIGDRVVGNEEKYQVSTAIQNPGPIKRSIFQINKVNSFDKVVNYGDKVTIQMNPYIFRKPLYMTSLPYSLSVYSHISRQQECTFTSTTNENYNTHWTIEYVDPNYRFEMQGQPVGVNQVGVLLKHCATQNFLSSDLNSKFKNDFGTECEVCVSNQSTKNRSQNLALEKQGKITSDLPTKFQQQQNIFVLLTAPDPAFSTPIEELNKFTIEDLIKEIKNKILDRSANGIRGISRIFKAMDDNGNHKLDVDDFRWGLIDYGIQLTKDQAQQILQSFDRDGDGFVDFNEFLRAIRGEINQNRLVYIKQAYEKLDVTKDGKVTIEDIARLYNADYHPDVISGKKSKEDVFREFLSQWDTIEKDGIVTLEEFIDYFKDVSASIDTDEYFAQMMINAWKL